MRSKNLKNKIRVAVLMGGPSSEHEVSLATAKNVIAALPKSKYQIKPILIDKKGQWVFKHYKKDPRRALKNVDVVFNALHGEYGEDGELQSILEKLKIKFTGSDQFASALAMDKLTSRKIFELADIKIPKAVAVRRAYYLGHQWVLNNIKKAFHFPVVVKPAKRGSSVGVSIVNESSELREAFHKAFESDDTVLVEEYIKGDELTCGVLEYDGKNIALPPTLIRPKKSHFFDYKAKYKAGWTEEVTPAPLPLKMTQKVQETAIKCHEVLGCRHYSRTDMILVGDRIYVLELNTLPGMTKTSLIPQQAKAHGIEFRELLEHLLNLALEAKWL
jgi:D-alanine-D-alanine ligase